MPNTGRGQSGNQSGNRNFSRGGRGNSNSNRNRSPMNFRGSNFNSGDQGNQGGDYFMQIKQDMEYVIQQTEQKLNALQIAYNALEQANEGMDEGNGNQGFSGHGRGSTDDQIDGRTTAGRQQEAEEYSPQDLNEFLKTGARSTVDGSYDLRTTEGRALEAAGWVDQEGFPIQGRGRMFINDNQVAGR